MEEVVCLPGSPVDLAGGGRLLDGRNRLLGLRVGEVAPRVGGEGAAAAGVLGGHALPVVGWGVAVGGAGWGRHVRVGAPTVGWVAVGVGGRGRVVVGCVAEQVVGWCAEVGPVARV